MRARRVSGGGSAAAPVRRSGREIVAGWQLGQTVQARVVRRLDEETYIINCQGAHICAQSHAGLSRGQRLSGKVRQLDPQVIVRIEPEKALGRADGIDVIV